MLQLLQKGPVVASRNAHHLCTWHLAPSCTAHMQPAPLAAAARVTSNAGASTSEAAHTNGLPRTGSRPRRRAEGVRQLFCSAAAQAPTTAAPASTSSSRKVKPAAPPKPAVEGPWLMVGLGNPGSQYERTRHNVGFMVIDALARSEGIDMRKLEHSAAVGRGQLHGQKVILAKPMTFMNNSGDSVAALARFYKVPPGQVLVVSDDLDQPTAAVRLRQKGGHGGHNGLRSIIQRLGGTHDFPRLKIGIGRPTGSLPVASYVLQAFSKSEQADIDAAIAESLRIIDSMMALGLDKALSGVRR